LPDAWDLHTRSAPNGHSRRLTQACTHLLTTSGPIEGFRPAHDPRSSNSKHKLCYGFSVIREIEIWRAAVLMVNRYADEAEANAEELASEGDHAGAAIWRRITVAIEQLTDTTGPLN
jgi:hypothetical protein